MAKDNFSGINVPPQLKSLSKNLRYIILAVLVFVLGFSSFFTVNPEEVGMVMRFGEFTRTAQPGLNYKIPFVEEVRYVPIQRQLKHEFGYRTTSSGVRSTYQKQGYQDESLMLTGDLNLADVEWVVQYRVTDPYNFLFKIRNPEETLRDMSEAAMRQVVGNRTVNEVLTVGRAEVTQRVQELTQELATEYESGINIEQIVLQDVNPPDPVKASFNAVNEAQQQKETLINQAKSEYNKVVPRAKGEAEQTIQQAEGYAINRINRAEGQASRFNQLYREYVKAPEVTKRRIYLETLEDILPKIGNKIVTDQNGNNVLPLLQMQMDGVKNVNQSNTSSSNSQGN
ncbi:MAG: FtsH protease activity modulator HflK [Fodinibius sp.]|nr:FtsH protease activity modulator HflK [Fodinibius sp.]